MTIDITRFHQTFFDESFEGLDAMEAALLRLSPDTADAETINVIFRAAHSIKGGSATFGFMAVAEFTHLLETLLDQMRSGQRVTGPVEIDVLLRSVDILRGLLNAARDATDVDTQAVADLSAELQRVLIGPVDGATAENAAAAEPNPEQKTRGWRIRFAPYSGLFASGNDPLRILAELSRLGEMTVQCNAEQLPDLPEANPECSYLSWTIELLGQDISQGDIAEVFAWVEDECDLQVEALVSDAAAAVTESAVPAAIKVEPASRPELQLIEGGRPSEVTPTARPPQPAAGAEIKAAPVRAEGGSIRVATEKIDGLINLVGELVITQAMLQQLAASLDPVQNEKLLNGLALLDRNTRSLQEAVMSTRMLPVDFVFSRFPRVVRDLAGKLGKQARLLMSGEHTELDKSVIERIADPLTHLVRNSLDHGIEPSDQRVAAGKDAVGTIRLSASHQGGNIVIEVADDGRGLDRMRIMAKARERGLSISDTASDDEVWRLIFAPGFSTAEAVTDVSGRGVGMDVVKKNIEALSGSVDITSETGRGSRITIRLPLTLAILDGMSVRVGTEIFIVPLNAVVESLQPQRDQVRTVAHQGQVVRVRSEYVPLVALGELFGIRAAVTEPEKGILVLLEADGRKIAVLVDELVGQQQVVIKSIEANYRRVSGVSGATILGDGRVALIVDIGDVIRRCSMAVAA
ncbi:chemotaxis protein CheA [Sinimarinibacterium sp. CAU 1509]|uniref:chemotaxis protein CheW n=1 Tax=Sinimarinibacterium sp. CAU 1509 TaxID=2562283 RepID=UPI0010AD7B50|nr:chemotaxis protein CheW [Sinimarinibacterium sp. CAU 1509]TJY62829.1 chemotaxis protein CheA [Sinimarinibacterium sp. CAU 1509]